MLCDHACNPAYLESWDPEDHSSRLARKENMQDSISKLTKPKQTRGVARVVEHLFCEDLSSNPRSHKKKNVSLKDISVRY
jgi:hypothetical protein